MPRKVKKRMKLGTKNLALSFFLVGVQSGFAQATFIFSNYGPGVGLDAPIFDAKGNRLSGTNYASVLYGGPMPGSLEPARVGGLDMPPVPFTYMPDGQSGYFGVGGEVVIWTVPPSGYAWLQVRAW